MIEHFFISKVRVKILKLYLQDQHQSFHVREIVRQTKEEINAVRRELINMEKAGLFTKEPKFNRVYYILNKNYPIFPELRAIIFKEFGLGGSIIRERENLGGVTFAILSSQYLNNEPMSPTELDLLVIGDTVNMDRLSILVKTIELDTSREINYTVLTTAQFTQQKQRREGYLKNLLDKAKLVLIGSEDDFLS
jgi:hypothetical protein